MEQDSSLTGNIECATESVIVDGDHGVSLTIQLEPDEFEAGQLGTNQFQDLTEESGVVTSSKFDSVYYLEARCRPTQYSIQRDKTGKEYPAALIVIDFDFQMRGELRFKKVRIDLEVLDEAALGLNPHAVKLDRTYQPQIQEFAPRYTQNSRSDALGQKGWQAGVSFGDPMNIASTNLSFSGTRPYALSRFTIQGSVEDDPSYKAVWIAREDELEKIGIIPGFTVAAVVHCTVGRKFVARVRVGAGIWLSAFRPFAAEKVRPIRFNPILNAQTPPVVWDSTFLHSLTALRS